jgi:hypothetical protein
MLDRIHDRCLQTTWAYPVKEHRLECALSTRRLTQFPRIYQRTIQVGFSSVERAI